MLLLPAHRAMAKRPSSRAAAPPLLVLLVLLFLLVSPALAFDADFSFYPANTQACLYNAAKASRCTGATAQELNGCLCGNGGNFVLATAECLGQSKMGNVATVYKTMSEACSNTGTPVRVVESQFYETAANAASSATTTMATATTTASGTAEATTAGAGVNVTVTPSSTSEPDHDQKSEGLSTGATVGVAVGASVAGVGLVGGLFWFILRKTKKQGEESHPMLPQFGQDPPFSPAPGMQPSPGLLSPPLGSEAKHPSWVSSLRSPDPSHLSAVSGWDSTHVLYKAPGGVVELPPQPATTVFEMDGTVPVVQQQQYQQQQQYPQPYQQQYQQPYQQPQQPQQQPAETQGFSPQRNNNAGSY